MILEPVIRGDSRCFTLKKLNTRLVPDDATEEEGGLFEASGRRPQETQQLITILLRDSPPPFIWRPGVGVLRDLVRLACRASSKA